MKTPSSLKLPDVSLPSAIIMITCASLCFLNSYDGNFVFDDSEAIVHNDDAKTTPIREIFQNDFWGMKLHNKHSHKSFRPLTTLTFRFQSWLRQGQLKSIDFHIVNISLHIVVSILSLFVFQILLDSDIKLPFYAAIIFAVHPVHTEAVSGIVGRADVLCALFVWLSVILYKCHIYSKNVFKKWLSMIMTILCISCAVLCKETGITAIGICTVYDLITVNRMHLFSLVELATLKYSREDITRFLKRNKSGLLARLSILWIAAVVLISLRFSVMGFTPPTFQAVDNPSSFVENIFYRILNYHYIHAINVWLLFCPEWLCFDWSMGCVPIINHFEARIFAVMLYWIFLIGLFIVAFSKQNSQFVRHVGIGLSLLIIPFLPASNFFFTVGFVLAERTLYIPSSGYCLLIAIGLECLSKRLNSKLCLFLFILLIDIFFIRSWMRSVEWRNETTLFQSGLNVCPLNAKVHYNIAKNAADTGNIDLAELEYNEAIRLHPKYAQAMNNLGNLLKNQGKYVEAEKSFRQAIAITKDFAAAWNNLGITLSFLRRYRESEESYITALTYRSKYPDCYYNLGVLYMENKFYEKALKAWETAIHQQNTHRKAWINMILLLNDLERTETALQMGKTALMYIPNDAAVHFNIGNMLGKVGKYEEAEKYFQTALYYEPKNALYYSNLGVLYHRWKKFNDAHKMYMKALEINPNLQSAKENLQKMKQFNKS